jgi:hypothetical protein
MTEKYNCFLCRNSYDKTCEGYLALDTNDKCLWKQVAENDLERNLKRERVILKDMFEEYNTKILTQEEVDRIF